MREQIIEKALQMFMTGGVLQTSLIDIAKELKITKGAIYHYFKNKEELLTESFNLIVLGMESFIIPMQSDEMSLKDAFAYLQEIMIHQSNDEMTGQYEFLLFCSRKHPELKQNLIEATNKFNEVFKNKIRKEQQAGLIDQNVDLDYVLLKISVFFEGLMYLDQVYAPVNLKVYAPKVFDELLNDLYKGA
ncbi:MULTISPECIES: TetR/AcrR family transcriptional regulator [unclassified Fusibacter]|uniref:TetR/AcrR family transcriptional regulator n=1 Tax=unclassified Fusibacter TaxID=2624464 RepID=UPI001013BC51|nr:MULTISPECIES: TetR/AcrR family transcriptional regulator [unclassified Fusibacter]MCK8058370.1 TetR/AcrR family transcriptional regulator [Fusibacter sp. A2]NPE20953.1 TetR/AcrR family transcriptional regulator [Fusibacter sp. A1]RXV63155.1 TetR/AcrR family transcriptional regulator [Fusibacter sp. A1]